jgi:hypothetical protein
LRKVDAGGEFPTAAVGIAAGTAWVPRPPTVSAARDSELSGLSWHAPIAQFQDRLPAFSQYPAPERTGAIGARSRFQSCTRSWAFGSGTARPPPQGSSFSCTGGSLIGVGEELRRATYGIPAGRASATTRHSTTYNGRRGGPPFPHATATPRGHRKCFAYLVPGRTPTLTEPTSAPLDAVVRQLDASD